MILLQRYEERKAVDCRELPLVGATTALRCSANTPSHVVGMTKLVTVVVEPRAAASALMKVAILTRAVPTECFERERRRELFEAALEHGGSIASSPSHGFQATDLPWLRRASHCEARFRW